MRRRKMFVKDPVALKSSRIILDYERASDPATKERRKAAVISAAKMRSKHYKRFLE